MYKKPRGVKVPPTSTDVLENTAVHVRRALHKAGELRVDVLRVVEHILHQMGVDYHIVESWEIDGEEARTYPDRNQIHISSDTYDSLLNGESRSRFTLAHEIAHLLVHRGISPSFARSGGHKIFEDSEWQADTFAAAFLAPAKLVEKHCRCIDDIVNTFGMSREAATIRARQLNKKGIIDWQ